MSSTFFSNFLSSDVLQETNLKPWYETIRGYLVFTNILVSIYMVYDMKSDGIIHCVSANGSVEFAASTITYANSFCSSALLHWGQRNLGLVCLLCSLAIYLSYCWWLLIPSVKRSFALVRECDDALKKIKGTTKDLKSILKIYYSKEKPSKDFSDDQLSQLILVTHRLWTGHSGTTSIFKIYQIRNVISLVILLGVLVILLASQTVSKMENPLDCELDVLNRAHVHCFAPVVDKLFPFFIVILIVTFSLLIGMMVLLWYTRRTCEYNKSMIHKALGKYSCYSCSLDKHDLKIIRHGKNCNDFVMMFSKASTSLSINTEKLMNFFNVIGREEMVNCTDRFRNFRQLMQRDKILNVTAEGKNDRSNTEIFNQLTAMHGAVRNGKYFHDFRKCHWQTFNHRYSDSDQKPDDDDCQCKSLFEGDIKTDEFGKSLMWYAFNHIFNTDYDIRLVAHLVLSSLDEAGNPRESSKVIYPSKVRVQSVRDFLSPKAEQNEHIIAIRNLVLRYRPGFFSNNVNDTEAVSDDEEAPMNEALLGETGDSGML